MADKSPFDNLDAEAKRETGYRRRNQQEAVLRIPTIFHVAAWMFVITWPFIIGGCLSIPARIVDTKFEFKRF